MNENTAMNLMERKRLDFKPYAEQDELIADYFELFDALGKKAKKEERERDREPAEFKERVKQKLRKKLSKGNTDTSCEATDACGDEAGNVKENLLDEKRKTVVYAEKITALEYKIARPISSSSFFGGRCPRISRTTFSER